MSKETKQVKVSVRLSEATAKKLVAEGKKNNEKLSEVIRKKLD
jgi:hypothetical protein